MWLERFLKLIDDSPIGRAAERRTELMKYTGEPARIYVENVRSFFGMPFKVAETLCELAVRQGLFEKCIAFLCPHDERILLDLCGEEKSVDDVVLCEICEAHDIEPSSFPLAEYRTLPFYRVRHSNA